jgi:hypothetical protein
MPQAHADVRGRLGGLRRSGMSQAAKTAVGTSNRAGSRANRSPCARPIRNMLAQPSYGGAVPLNEGPDACCLGSATVAGAGRPRVLVSVIEKLN